MSERSLSRQAPTRRGIHDRLVALDAGHAPDFDPRRTLGLRVEFSRQLRRRRTQIAFGLLLLLPLIIALAFQLGGSAGNGSPEIVSLATAGASNFVVFTEFVSVGFLLVVVVALFCGDTVASEAGWSSLRYLLAQPVPRARLLKQKLIVAGLLCVGANVVLPVWSYLVGGVFFGWGAARSPIGGSLSMGASLVRLVVIVAFVCVQLSIYASLAFLLSVSVDNPLGAVGGAVLLAVLSSILNQITALGDYRRYLPSYFNTAWVDALTAPIRWDDMIRGAGLSLVYVAVFLGIAWVRFDRKDITS